MEEQNGSFLQQNNPLNEQPLTAEASRLNDEAKIKEILVEQTKLQQLYNEVVVYIQQHPQMPTEEMIKYQTQLKQLSEYYQKNQEKLKTLGYSSVQVNKNVTIKKWSSRNLSVKTIFLWCAAIIFLFVLWLWALSYYLASHPDSLGGFTALGISAATAKSILSLLSVAVMMVILLLGLVILIVNTYRAFTVKNRWKWWYYSWIIFWLMIIWIALAAGTTLISKVWSIDVDSIVNPDDVVWMNMIRYVPVTEKDKNTGEEKVIGWQEETDKSHLIDNSFYVIAPVNIWAQLFSSNYKEYLNAKFSNVIIGGVQLDCWNGQSLPLSNDNIHFYGQCFYTKKGDYKISLQFLTIDGNNERTVETHYMKTLRVDSEIIVKWINTQLNEESNELSVWPIPADVEFDASNVFKDLNLQEYNLNWYWENIGSIDKINEIAYHHSYDTSKVYYPKIQFSDLHYIDEGGDWYSFPLRVTPSSKPVCKLELTQEQGLDYKIQWTFLNSSDRSVSDYSFEIRDKFTNAVIDTIPWKGNTYSLSHRFQWKGSYLVKLNFKTDYWEEWSCEKELVLTEKATFDVKYEFSASNSSSNWYEKISIDENSNVIKLTTIPSNVKVKIISIDPRTKDSTVTVTVDGSPKVASSTDEYTFDIIDSEPHKIVIRVEDTNRWLEFEKEFEAKIGLDDLVGKLSIIWDTIGFEPFTVTLDASASRLTDPSDQITYFTWDFWDGESQQKVSNWVVKHAYRFDYKNNNGTFTPKVTVYTQKGRSITVTAPSTIAVKKQVAKLEIYSTSHPLQEARVWDKVDLALEFNWLPKRITWDFWDGEQALEWEWRTYTEVTKTWNSKWTYLIKVLVDFEDQQSVEQTFQFKIR